MKKTHQKININAFFHFTCYYTSYNKIFLFYEGKIKAAENGVCFYLKKFALQTFLSSVVSHFVAKQLKKSILKLKFYS